MIAVPTAELIAGGDATVDRRSGGRRPALLPHRAAHRADLARPRRPSTAASSSPARTRRWTIRPTSPATPTARGAITAGARVRVRLTMVAESQRAHVALIDPLPAGLEIVNPALATSQDAPPPSADDDPAVRRLVRRRGGGARGSSTRTCATTAPRPSPGTSRPASTTTRTSPRRRRRASSSCPPTRAEEIYSPETFGRAATDRVVVG